MCLPLKPELKGKDCERRHTSYSQSQAAVFDWKTGPNPLNVIITITITMFYSLIGYIKLELCIVKRGDRWGDWIQRYASSTGYSNIP